MSGGRGRGRGGPSNDPIPAENIGSTPPLTFYARDHRQRVHEQILAEDAVLRRRVDNERGGDDDTCDAEDELWDRGYAILKREYESLSREEKAGFEHESLEAKYDNWRRFREMGRLIENEESLMQKARDDAMGIKGPQNSSRGRGRGGASAPFLSQQQTTGTFVGGVLVNTAREEITPPFNKNTMRVKIGKIQSEEFF